MMKDRYLFPRKIKYKTDGIMCYTDCPYDDRVCVGSHGCASCLFFLGQTKTHVLCVRKSKKGGK